TGRLAPLFLSLRKGENVLHISGRLRSRLRREAHAPIEAERLDPALLIRGSHVI
ncbi:hypothetical protein A2U01_0094355, partial [Trifolium medium]|nr:hypothetical protein [Trifolium medium]